MVDTTAIDMLFLELSQFTRAMTANELALRAEAERLRAEVERLEKDLDAERHARMVAETSVGAQERGRLRAEVERMRGVAKDLITVVRMPNQEWVADKHNIAVKILRGEEG